MLKVKTLGCLQLIWDGQPVSLGKQAGNNIAKLFVILALQGEQGIPRRELIRQLFYQQSAEFDTGANLRITVYRLRRALKNAWIPCPEGEDYILSGRGLYRWNPSIPLSVDVVEFRDLAAKAEAETDREASLRLGQEAFALCLGEFLPEFGSEEWVGRWQAEWERTFKELFLQQYGLMIQGGGHVRAYNLAKWAASLYPYEEYQIYMLDCLIARNHYDEAFQLYEDTTAMYFREIGMEPSEAMKERLEKIQNANYAAQTTLDRIREQLENNETWDYGPYDCPLPRFIDNYQFVKYTIQRSGQPASVLVMTMEDSRKVPLTPGEERTVEIGRILRECIRKTGRKSDMMTQYDGLTFLLLLIGVGESECWMIADRILRRFRENCPFKKVRVNFQIIPLKKRAQ